MAQEPRIGLATRDLENIGSIDMISSSGLSVAIKNVADDLSDALTAISIYINSGRHYAQSREIAEDYRVLMTLAAGQMVRSAKALHRLHDLASVIQRELGERPEGESID